MARNHKFRCHGCGQDFHSDTGGDLFCSSECQKQYIAAQEMHKALLRNHGFEQVKDAPNLWVKDGVHLAIEHVLRNGLDSALADHAEARSRTR